MRGGGTRFRARKSARNLRDSDFDFRNASEHVELGDVEASVAVDHGGVHAGQMRREEGATGTCEERARCVLENNQIEPATAAATTSRCADFSSHLMKLLHLGTLSNAPAERYEKRGNRFSGGKHSLQVLSDAVQAL
jgi:hypothetical protein